MTAMDMKKMYNWYDILEGGYLPKFSLGWSSTQKKLTQSDLKFCENERSQNLKSMKKGVNWFENQGVNWYKCLKSVN